MLEKDVIDPRVSSAAGQAGDNDAALHSPAGDMSGLHFHLVSDATGETIRRVARACLVQFGVVGVVEHVWSLVRSDTHVRKVLAGIAAHPGPVLFTVVETDLRATLEEGCRRLDVPHLSVLDPILGTLARHLGVESAAVPGRQHQLDADYFKRIEAMEFTLHHDDGQRTDELDLADIVLVGVSRTSKTPTSLYLANRGMRVANVPLVPDTPLPSGLLSIRHPLVVGLTKDPHRLAEVRRARLRHLKEDMDTTYTDPEWIEGELRYARRLCREHGWPLINVTQRSIEETAAAILSRFDARRGLLS